MHGQVLLCGTDSTLLSTRREVLRSVGYNVLTASLPAEIGIIVRGRTIDALVLCHTLLPEQQRAAIAILRRYVPSAKSVILTKSATCETNVNSDAVISTVDGPRVMIEAMVRLLSNAPAKTGVGYSDSKEAATKR